MDAENFASGGNDTPKDSALAWYSSARVLLVSRCEYLVAVSHSMETLQPVGKEQILNRVHPMLTHLLNTKFFLAQTKLPSLFGKKIGLFDPL